jgi:hypothetical protein
MSDCKTWRDAKNIILVLVCAAAFAVIGCRGLVDRITPAELPPRVSDYLCIENPPEIVSLHDAKRIKDDVVVEHRTTQTDLMRAAEDDETYYQDAIAFIQQSIVEAQEFQDLVVGSEDQPFSVLGVLAGLTGGAAIGRALKRKGDYSPAEVREIVAKAKTGALTDPPATGA